MLLLAVGYGEGTEMVTSRGQAGLARSLHCVPLAHCAESDSNLSHSASLRSLLGIVVAQTCLSRSFEAVCAGPDSNRSETVALTAFARCDSQGSNQPARSLASLCSARSLRGTGFEPADSYETAS